MLKKIMSHKSETIMSGAFMVAVFYLISGVLAFLRNSLLAGHFGAGEELDVYYAAFRLPDLIYAILITGALTAGFIPLFAEKLSSSKEEAKEFANEIISSLSVIFFVGSLIIMIFAPFFSKLIAPGFSLQKQESMSILIRIMMIQPVILGISNLFGAVLQNYRMFFASSLSPVFYNLGVIVGIIFFAPIWGIKGLAWGIILGATFHLLIQLPALISSGFNFRFSPKFNSENLKRIFSLAGPRALGLISIQINFLSATVFASSLAAGSLAIFSFANDLQNLPQSIFAVSLAMSAFPIMSQLANKKEEFTDVFKKTAEKTFFFMAPISLIFIAISRQIVDAVLHYGKFSSASALASSVVLVIFSFGMIFQSFLPILVRAFFSLKNSWMPFWAGFFGNVLNIVLSFLLIKRIGIYGLAFAYVSAITLNFFLLWFWLRKKLFVSEFGIFKPFLRIFLSALCASILSGLFVLIFSGKFVWLGRFQDLGLAGCSGLFGLIVYVAILFLIKAPEVVWIKNFFFRFEK